jgi:hypothetical protein
MLPAIKDAFFIGLAMWLYPKIIKDPHKVGEFHIFAGLMMALSIIHHLLN